MEVSLTWTTPAFLAGFKTVTRRGWTGLTVSRCPVGTPLELVDRPLRFGGRLVGRTSVASIERQRLGDMPDSYWEAEGFGWLQERGALVRGHAGLPDGFTPHELWNFWRSTPDVEKVVIRFGPKIEILSD